MKIISSVLGLALLSTNLMAGVSIQPVADKKIIVPMEEPSRLSISAGALVREIDTDFYTHPGARDFCISGCIEAIEERNNVDVFKHGDTHSGDRNTVGAPYLKADYRLLGMGDDSFSVFGQYSWVPESDYSSGTLHKLLLKKPLNDDPQITSVTRSNLDLSLHEFTLGFGYQRRLVNRVHLTLAVGPTFNLFDSNYHSKTEVYGNAERAPRSLKVSDDGQDFRIGAMGQIGLKIDLDSRSRYFVEVFGRYNWVDTLNIGTSKSHVEVDASSFSGGVGVGVNL